MRPPRIWMLAGACLLGTACDLPTEPPVFAQRWVLPLQVVTLDQTEFLPAEVSIDGSVYDVTVGDAAASADLADVCSTCDYGATATTPPFQDSFLSSVGLPTDLVSVDVVGGSVEVTLTNDFSFDPLYGGGTLTVTVTGASSGPTLGTLVLDGATESLAPGSVTIRTVQLGSGTVVGGIEATVQIDHPGGAPTTLDLTQALSISAVTEAFLVGSATVVVDGRTVSLTEESLDVENLDTSVTDGIQSGTVTLDVTNPYGVTFDGTITVGTITKDVSIDAAATSVVEIAFTGDELRSFLGQPSVTLSGSGTIAGGPAVVTPLADLSIDTTIDLLVEFGR